MPITRTRPECQQPYALMVGSLALALEVLGCTAISDFEVAQCQIDADCDTLDGPVAQCVESRCVPGCSSNRHCASVDPRFPICPRVAEQCVPLTIGGGVCYAASNYDDARMGPLTGEELLTIGAFAPSVQSSTWLTVQLAAAELNASGGLPTASGGNGPVLVVVCNDAPSTMADAIAHLSRLPVRALLASVEQRSLDVALSLNARRGEALVLAPRGSERLLVDGGMDLSWSLGAPSSAVLTAYPMLIQQVAQAAVARGAAPDLVRVASLVSAAPEDRALSDSVAARLDLGGKDMNRLMIEDRFRSFPLTDDYESERLRVLQELARYAPDLILVFAAGFFGDADRRPRTSALSTLEELSAAIPGWSPLYVLGPRNLDDVVVRELALGAGSFRSRNVGLTADPATDADMTGALAARFAEAFPNAGGELFLQPSTYDALYYLSYALALSPRGGTSLLASDVLQGLRQVTDAGAERIDVGPGATGLERATSLLGAGAPFDLFGTSGPARFDVSHTRSAAVRAYCWPAAGQPETITAYADGTPDSANSPLVCGGEVLGGPVP